MTKKELEKRIEELERKVRDLQYPPYHVPNLPSEIRPAFDPACLHNGCGHDRGIVTCMLYCPHCSPMA